MYKRQEYDLSAPPVTDPVWGGETPYGGNGISCNYHWLEGVIGIRNTKVPMKIKATIAATINFEYFFISFISYICLLYTSVGMRKGVSVWRCRCPRDDGLQIDSDLLLLLSVLLSLKILLPLLLWMWYRENWSIWDCGSSQHHRWTGFRITDSCTWSCFYQRRCYSFICSRRYSDRKSVV